MEARAKKLVRTAHKAAEVRTLSHSHLVPVYPVARHGIKRYCNKWLQAEKGKAKETVAAALAAKKASQSSTEQLQQQLAIAQRAIKETEDRAQRRQVTCALACFCI